METSPPQDQLMLRSINTSLLELYYNNNLNLTIYTLLDKPFS